MKSGPEAVSAKPAVDAALARSATRRPDGTRARLHGKLSSFGVLLLTLSCLSPVFYIYGVGADVLQRTGTGAAGLFLAGIGVVDGFDKVSFAAHTRNLHQILFMKVTSQGRIAMEILISRGGRVARYVWVDRHARGCRRMAGVEKSSC